MTNASLLTVLFALATLYAQAQTLQVLPLTAAAWDTEGLPVEFSAHLGVPSLYIGPAGPGMRDATITLRDFTFANGTLEFDFAPEDSSVFAALHFRRDEQGNSEHVYLRTFFAGQTRVIEAFQYAAVVDGVNYWDLSPDFQAAVSINATGWNHVKLVVRGQQLLAYVNNSTVPVLYVPHMDARLQRGALAFAGRGHYANLTYSPATEGLGGEVGYDPTLGDGRYVRTWQVSAPRQLEATRALSSLQLPSDTVTFSGIAAERLGLVNLSRPFGKTERGSRRLAWLRTTINSETAREVTVDLGFSDEIAIWVNGRLVLTDENNYGSLQMKYPKGRASLDNTRFRLPLREGNNELTVALANDFFGWGMLMRVQETVGLAW